MGYLKEVLFGKVDLDTILTALVMGVNPIEQAFVAIAGSASAVQLADPSILCIEVGGSGRVDKNNFDHHLPGQTSLSAAAQSLERMARIIRYVDDLDCGRMDKTVLNKAGFPTLAQLISGMLLVVKSPKKQMEQGLIVLREVLHSGIDPYGCMEPILDSIPHARWWAAQKKLHERDLDKVYTDAQWFTTASGCKLAVIETELIGIPGTLYGKGADLVIAFNPKFEVKGKCIRKFSVCGNEIKVNSILEKIEETGWGGPQHGTFVGSPTDKSSNLTIEEVKDLVVEVL